LWPLHLRDKLFFKILTLGEKFHLLAQLWQAQEKIVFRIKFANPYFYCAYDLTSRKRLIGFVNGTKTKEHELHEENMSMHDSEGKTLCIHSVVIQPELRRKGLATKMLNEYIKRVVKKEEKVTLILLICKENLKGFYEKVWIQIYWTF